MRTFLITSALALACGAASAQCIGSGSLYTCSDSSGNSYTVNRLGSMTMMSGSNAATGSQWSQTSSQLGNTTYINGQTNGRAWNNTITTMPGMTMQSGTDSRGRSFTKTCNAYGCF